MSEIELFAGDQSLGRIDPEFNPEEAYLTEDERKFAVTDDQSAEWCLDQIRAAKAEKEKWTDFYMKALKKICDREDFRIQYMEKLLKPYFYSVPHKQTKTQSSYQLPGGKLVMKAQEPAYERDDEQLLAWLHESRREEFVKVKESVDWSGLKKSLEGAEGLAIDNGQVITPDGEIVPGITAVERPNIFKVEVK